jgi:hypothetical protein
LVIFRNLVFHDRALTPLLRALPNDQTPQAPQRHFNCTGLARK